MRGEKEGGKVVNGIHVSQEDKGGHEEDMVEAGGGIIKRMYETITIKPIILYKEANKGLRTQR